MAVPKMKISKARRNSRKANWKASTPSIAKCPNCGEMKALHKVCKHCGYYKNEKKVELKSDKKQDEQE